jgi:hypothetical protein
VQHTHTHLQMEVPKLLLRISAIEGQVLGSTDLPLQKLPYAVLGLIRSRPFPCNHLLPRCRPWTTLHPHPVHRVHLPPRPNPLLLLLPVNPPSFSLTHHPPGSSSSLLSILSPLSTTTTTPDPNSTSARHLHSAMANYSKATGSRKPAHKIKP